MLRRFFRTMIGTSWSRHMKDEANRGAQSMHRNRPHAAIAAVLAPLSLVMAALAFAWVHGPVDQDGIAQMGIEGEGDLPLPVTEQT
jgi:hypothetical protein